jgi:hypothetical protein
LEWDRLRCCTPCYQGYYAKTCAYDFELVFHFNLQLDCLILFHLPISRQR